MSNQQEKIISDSNGIKSRSPFLKDINRKQDNIDRQLNQITKQLTNLSNSTFFVNPKINRQIGGLKSSISKSISNIEQKQVTTAFKEHEKILKYIIKFVAGVFVYKNRALQVPVVHTGCPTSSL